MTADLRLQSAAGRGLVVATVLGSGLALLDGTVVNVALPHLGAELHASMQDLQWTINAYTLPLAAFVLLGGALGDRYGRRKLFLTGVIWFTLSSVMCGLSQDIGMLIAARALQGAGAALLTPGSLALIQSSLHPDDRARAIGAWAGLGGVAGALGPLVGGWLIDSFSWRWIFFLNVPLAIAVVIITLRFVPESRSAAERHRFDVTGALLGAVGLAGITYALLSANLVLVPALVGVAALIAFVLVESRTANPMMPTSLFRSHQFSAINGVTLLVYSALAGIIFFVVLELQVVVGLSAIAAGSSTLPLTAFLLLGSSRAGAFGKKVGPQIPLTIGCVIAATSALLLTRIGPNAVYWRDVIPPMALLGLGMTTMVAPLTSSVLAAAPDQLAGVASGVNNAVARAGSLLAVAALPALVGLTGTMYTDKLAFNDRFHHALLWGSGLLAVGAAVAALFVRATEHTARVEARCTVTAAGQSTPAAFHSRV